VRINFPPELPVSGRRADIAEALSGHQVVIVAGETGSGKTTQLPKICLALGRGRDAMIGHTQPRRIAARSVAERIASELGSELGELVGYQVRFTDRTSKASRIKVMTDGILLAELQHDPRLRRYDTLIIDEAHERSLNIDFLLGYLKRLLPQRPDLKVIITSATIDPERFSRHFDDAPIIEVSGRTYPVEIRYRPLMDLDELDEDGDVLVKDQTEAIEDAVAELMSATDGDVLVFLPGEREIRDTADALKRRSEDQRRGFDIVPLYSRLSAAEQHKVFERHTRRRVVLATNVAETSLTVPGITAVVDTGLARISRWSARTKVQRLPIEPISQASARQRSGRCGRTEAGVAIRLYGEEDFEARPEFTDPEILRTSLASVILQMASLGLGEVAGFPFVEPPDQRAVRDGVALLEELGALDNSRGKNRLTKLGRRLARLPIDPRLGRMVLEGDRLGCLREILVIAAALSIQDPRERPAEHQARADQLHARFRDDTSDFAAWLNLWRYLREQQEERSSSGFRRMCRDEHLNYLRVREWQDLERQLRQIAREMGMKVPKSGSPPKPDLVHQALLSGLLSHIGAKEERERPRPGQRRPMQEYVGARGARFAVFPGSGLARRQPDFVMAAELVETSRLWARQVAKIEPEWAERLGRHLVKYHWSEPHWSRKRAAAMAHERVTLYGVPLVADRLVQAGRHQPEVARELFIRHALVEGDWHAQHRFLARNRELLEEAEELEHRARRRGIVVDAETLVDFYDQRLPETIVSGAHFDSWWKQQRRETPDLLTFDPAMLVRDDTGVSATAYPDAWQEEHLTLPVSYHFEPGHVADGVSIDVPVASLNTLGSDAFTWQVPGLREELVIALIRALPKQLRVNFVPVPDFARGFLADTAPGEETLTESLSRYLRGRTGVHVPESAWDLDAVPDHLRATFRIVGPDGAELAAGKDLEALKRQLQPELEAALDAVAEDAEFSVTGQESWSFGAIPESFTTTRAGHEVHGYPALVDEGSSVGLRVFGQPTEAAAHHRLGLRRLVLLNLSSPAAEVIRELDNARKLALAASPYPNVRALVDDCVLALAGEAVTGTERDQEAFNAALARARADLTARTAQRLDQVIVVLGEWRETDRLLHGRVDLPLLPAMTDLRAQLARLVGPGFVADAGPALADLPRYLKAMRLRVDKLGDLSRDRAYQDLVEPLQQAWQHRVDALPDPAAVPEDLVRSRWLLEEFRVSLWAQQLGTRESVSERRIRRLLC